MNLTAEPPPCPDSPLRRLDPRWKLATLLLAAAATVSLRTPPAAALALVGAVALVPVGRLPARWYLTRVGAAALFLVPFAGLLPFLTFDGGPSWDLGPVRASVRGTTTGLLMCAKGLAVVTLALVALGTTPLPDLLKAAHALRLPGLVVQLVALSYRYLFIVAEELNRLRVALRVRGYRNRADRHSYRTVGHVTGSLLVRGYERAERVGQAMRCRGFDGRYRSLADFRTRAADVAAFATVAASATALVLWDWSRA
jgi:cobalt/nickel transport system permease protein